MNPVQNPSPRRPRSRWPLALLVLLLTLLGVAALAWNVVGHMSMAPVNITIDGERVVDGLDLSAMPAAEKLVLALVVGLALMSALVVLPIALLMALAGVLVAIVAVIGLPMLVVLVVLAVLLSPLLLLVWLIWWALRPSPTITP